MDREEQSYDQTSDSLLDNVEVSGSTPRPPRPKIGAKFADYSSPYEALKREVKGRSEDEGDEHTTPSTPDPKSRLPDMSMTPKSSSPFEPQSHLQSAHQRTAADKVLLHRVLDKNYRVQATPHKAQNERRTPAAKASWRDVDSPMSSPPAAAPQLRAEIFSSPVKLQYNRPNAPRTPGISLQTPAVGKSRDVTKLPKKDEITWESDSDEDPEGVYRELGMSPPKTIQFSMPQSRLLQTPGTCVLHHQIKKTNSTASAGSQQTDRSRSARHSRSRI